jgi:hypothetical protein
MTITNTVERQGVAERPLTLAEIAELVKAAHADITEVATGAGEFSMRRKVVGWPMPAPGKKA